MAPKISVLLPTYNYARYLPQALDSVLAQSESDFEVIVRDDGSSDGSSALLAEYVARDPRIRCLPGDQNLGMVANWNLCLGAARGRYVKYLFGDDCLADRDALGRYAALLDDHDSAVMAVSSRLIIDANSRVMGRRDEIGPAGIYDGPGLVARCLWLDRNVIGEPSAVMFRRNRATRGFDSTLRQVVDLEMWFYLLEQGNLIYDPSPLCAFRVHEHQQTEVNRELRIGALESLRVTARHLPLVSRHFGTQAKARVVYRTLHYSRKRNPRTADVATAEAIVASHAGWFAKSRCALAHRISRPWQNLLRWWNKSSGEPPLRESDLSWVPLGRFTSELSSSHHELAS